MRLVQFAALVTFIGDRPAPVVVIAWATVAIALLIGLWLLVRGGRLAARWFDDPPLGVSFGPRVVLRLALVVLGVTFVALGVTGLFGAVASGILTWPDVYGSPTHWMWQVALTAAIYPVAELVAGVVLIAYSVRLARVLWRQAPSGPAELAPRAEAAPPLAQPQREEA
jgi:hypothetical protein